MRWGFFVQKIQRTLASRGIRPTRARCQILQMLMGSDCHSTVEELLASLNARGERASPSTLYQNLSRLTREGVLFSFQGADQIMRFDANLKAHHHVMCSQCRRIVDVSFQGELSDLITPLFPNTPHSDLNKWTLNPTCLMFHGICNSCAKTQKSAEVLD